MLRLLERINCQRVWNLFYPLCTVAVRPFPHCQVLARCLRTIFKVCLVALTCSLHSSKESSVIMARRRLEAAIRVGKEIDHQQTTENDLFKGIKMLGMASMEEKMMGVYSLQFSMEGDQLAVGCGNGSIIVSASSLLHY